MTYIPNIRKPNYSLRMQSVIDYAENKSIPIPGRKFLTYLDRHVTDLDDRGSLVKLDSYHNFAGQADPAFKLINLVDPYTHEFMAYGGLIWDKDGVKGNGVNGYIDTVTNLSNLTNYDIEDACRFGVIADYDDSTIIDTWSRFNNNSTDRYRLDSSVITRIHHTGGNGSSSINRKRIGLHYLERTSEDDINLIIKDDSEALTATINVANINYKIAFIGNGNSIYSETKFSNFGQGKALGYANTQHLRASYNKFLKSILLPEIA